MGGINEMLDEQKKYYLYMYTGWLVAFVFVWYLLSREPIHDNGGRADTVAGGISAAKEFNTEAQRQSEYIGTGAREAKISADRLADVQRDTSKTVKELAESVDRCQRLLDKISARAESDTKAPKTAEGSL